METPDSGNTSYHKNRFFRDLDRKLVHESEDQEDLLGNTPPQFRDDYGDSVRKPPLHNSKPFDAQSSNIINDLKKRMINDYGLTTVIPNLFGAEEDNEDQTTPRKSYTGLLSPKFQRTASFQNPRISFSNRVNKDDDVNGYALDNEDEPQYIINSNPEIPNEKFEGQNETETGFFKPETRPSLIDNYESALLGSERQANRPVEQEPETPKMASEPIQQPHSHKSSYSKPKPNDEKESVGSISLKNPHHVPAKSATSLSSNDASIDTKLSQQRPTHSKSTASLRPRDTQIGKHQEKTSIYGKNAIRPKVTPGYMPSSNNPYEKDATLKIIKDDISLNILTQMHRDPNRKNLPANILEERAQQRHTCAHCLMMKRQYLVPRKAGKGAPPLNHDLNCKHYNLTEDKTPTKDRESPKPNKWLDRQSSQAAFILTGSLDASVNNILADLDEAAAESKLLVKDNIDQNELKALLELTENDLYSAEGQIKDLKKERELLKDELMKLMGSKSNSLSSDAVEGYMQQWMSLLEDIKRHLIANGSFYTNEKATNEELKGLLEKYEKFGQQAFGLVPKNLNKPLQKDSETLPKDHKTTGDKGKKQLNVMTDLKAENERLLKRLIELMQGLMDKLAEAKYTPNTGSERQLRDELLRVRLADEKKQQIIDKLVKKCERLEEDLEKAYEREINSAPDGLKNNVRKMIELQKRVDALERENFDIKDDYKRYAKEKEEFDDQKRALMNQLNAKFGGDGSKGLSEYLKDFDSLSLMNGKAGSSQSDSVKEEGSTRVDELESELDAMRNQNEDLERRLKNFLSSHKLDEAINQLSLIILSKGGAENLDNDTKRLIKDLFGDTMSNLIKQYERKIAELNKQNKKLEEDLRQERTLGKVLNDKIIYLCELFFDIIQDLEKAEQSHNLPPELSDLLARLDEEKLRIVDLYTEATKSGSEYDHNHDKGLVKSTVQSQVLDEDEGTSNPPLFGNARWSLAPVVNTNELKKEIEQLKEQNDALDSKLSTQMLENTSLQAQISKLQQKAQDSPARSEHNKSNSYIKELQQYKRDFEKADRANAELRKIIEGFESKLASPIRGAKNHSKLSSMNNTYVEDASEMAENNMPIIDSNDYLMIIHLQASAIEDQIHKSQAAECSPLQANFSRIVDSMNIFKDDSGPVDLIKQFSFTTGIGGEP